MRVFVVVAAMLFCMAGCSRKEIQKIAVESQGGADAGIELVEIPAGTFMMGSDIPAGGVFIPEGRKKVSVTLTKPFGLGKYEVTQGQWKSVMGTEPWRREGSDSNAPVTGGITQANAIYFCKKLTEIEHKNGRLKANEEYRLPTDAEWEYACRAGTTTAFSFGDDEKQLGDYAWFSGNTVDATEEYAHKVGLKKPNPWGLYDMHGNVEEWCSDPHNNQHPPGAIDPVNTNKTTGARRGGSWRSSAYSTRSEQSGSGPAGHILGFRVARSQSVQ